MRHHTLQSRHHTLQSRHRILALESLENRQLLTVISPPPFGSGPVVVAPPVAGYAPIILPGSVTAPPDTTPVTPPATGQLPPGLPPLAGNAENIAAAAFASFQANHPAATAQVTDQLFATMGRYTLTVTENDGQGDSITETVSETAASVSVTMSSQDGAIAQALIAHESTQGKMDGSRRQRAQQRLPQWQHRGPDRRTHPHPELLSGT